MLIGKTLGPYRIENLIGSGGMAEVYRATHLSLEKEVAIKVLPDRHADSHELLRRFRREVQFLAELHHPGIVEVYDADVIEGTHFYTMPLITSPTLASLLEGARSRGARLPLRQSLNLVLSLLETLEVVHQAGIFHRDLKPSNLFVTSNDTALLADFGLAGSSNRTAITGEGQLLGTLLYASPEQLTGSAVDGRSDLYSAGLLLYELVCGRLPFEDTVVQAYHQKTSGQEIPPPSTLDPGISPNLDRIIARAVQSDPEKRFSSAASFRFALERSNLHRGKTEKKARPTQGGVPASPHQTTTAPAVSPPKLAVRAVALGVVFFLGSMAGRTSVPRALPVTEITSSLAATVTPSAGPPAEAPRLPPALASLVALWPGYSPPALEVQFHEVAARISRNEPVSDEVADRVLSAMSRRLPAAAAWAMEDEARGTWLMGIHLRLASGVPSLQAPKADRGVIVLQSKRVIQGLASTIGGATTLIRANRAQRTNPAGIGLVELNEFIAYLEAMHPEVCEEWGPDSITPVGSMFQPYESERVLLRLGEIDRRLTQIFRRR